MLCDLILLFLFHPLFIFQSIFPAFIALFTCPGVFFSLMSMLLIQCLSFDVFQSLFLRSGFISGFSTLFTCPSFVFRQTFRHIIVLSLISVLLILILSFPLFLVLCSRSSFISRLCCITFMSSFYRLPLLQDTSGCSRVKFPISSGYCS